MNNIKMIEKQLTKQTLIVSLIIIILIIFIIFSKFVSHIDIIDFWFPLLLILSLFVYISGISTAIKIKQLKSVEFLKNELDNIVLYCQNEYILTENYIIPHLSRKKIIKYSDIVLIYKKNHKTTDGLDVYLYLVLNNGNKEKLLINTTAIFVGSNAEPQDISKIIVDKNVNILVGNTEYNNNLIFQKYGIKI